MTDERLRDSARMPLLPGVAADAALSPCGTYRYRLSRSWAATAGEARSVTFVMLNPSVADADSDDRTLRKCQKYARRWGFTHLTVVNLFALRATKPAELERHPDPIGPDNDATILAAATAADAELVVAAWGHHGVLYSRGLIVLDRLKSLGVAPMRLGPATKGGHPWHPLLRRDDCELEPA